MDVSLGGQTLPSYDMYLSARGLSRDVAVLVNHYNVAYEMLRHTDLIAVLPLHLGALTPHAPYLRAVPLPMHARRRAPSRCSGTSATTPCRPSAGCGARWWTCSRRARTWRRTRAEAVGAGAPGGGAEPADSDAAAVRPRAVPRQSSSSIAGP